MFPSVTTASGLIYRFETKEPGRSYPLYRQPHDKELILPGVSPKSPNRIYRGDSNGTGRDTKGKNAIPEPYRIFPDHQTPLNCEWQRLIRDCNPEHKPEVVDKVLDQAWILANNTGIGVYGRKNCRTGEFMNDPLAKWPALHAPIICGGATLRGVEIAGQLHIQSLRTTQPVPTAEFVLAHEYLWFWLTQINTDGIITLMTLSAIDGTRRGVRMPLISRAQLYAPLSWFHKILPDERVPFATQFA